MSPKVILISLDGATSSIVDRYLANGVLSQNEGLGLLRNKGVGVSNETITPSLTAPSHIAIATGSTAANNDINANSFHLIASPFSQNISGFGAPIGGYDALNPDSPKESANPTAEPLWVGLRDAGKKVVTATFPGGDGVDVKVPGLTNSAIVQSKDVRTVDYTIPFGSFGGVGGKGFSLDASNFSLDPAQAIAGLAALGQQSFSPVKVANLETISSVTGGGGPYNLEVAAIDTTNDSATNYDTLVFFDASKGIVAPSSLPSTGSAFVKASDKKSSQFFFEGSTNKVGTAFYVSNLAPDLSTVRIARYSANYIPRPAESPGVIANVDDINNNVGFWAPQADFRFPERINTGLSAFSDAELEAIYTDQVKSFVNYQTKVALRSIQKNPDADLVMTYIEQPDGSEHQFLLTDSRQPSNFTDPNTIGAGQDPAKVSRYQTYIQAAYQSANAAVQSIIDSVGTDRNGVPKSNIIVVSDHGFAPFHTTVSINNILKNSGDPVLADPNKVRAVNSGPAVNIYINLQGREPNGTVTPQEYVALQQKIINTLQDVADTNPNYSLGDSSTDVFDKIYSRPVPPNPTAQDIIKSTSDFIGQDTGDVFALLNLGYNFDGIQGAGLQRKGDPASTSPILSVPNFYGAHGYDPKRPEMQAIFYAAGPDITNKNITKVRNIDIAPTIDKLLDVPANPTVDGSPIPLSRSSTPGLNLTGTERADFLEGGKSNDTIQGLGGDDTIFGLGGDDTLSGDRGQDLLFGNQGDDSLNGGRGSDTLNGGKGNDTLFGDRGNDLLLGGFGNDFLNGELGSDTLVGVNSNEEKPGLGEIDTLTGGSGSDVFELGNRSRAYYNDLNSSSAGTSDYALITDFNPNEDFIQLKAGLTYLIGASPAGLPTGVGIFIDNDGTPGLTANDEAIGILQNLTSSDVNTIASRFTLV
jgi:Ca2+-binding RTX toxin-like protein